MPRNGPHSFWMDPLPPVEPLRLRRVPMLLAAVAFAIGILFAREWHGAMLLLTATLLLFLACMLALRLAPRIAWAPVLGVWAAVGCWCAAVQPPVSGQAELRSYA